MLNENPRGNVCGHALEALKLMRLANLGLGVGFLLAGCEATPVLDPANYYPNVRYYEDPLPTEKAFWKLDRTTQTES